MKSNSFSPAASATLAFLLWAAPPSSFAQGSGVLTVTAPPRTLVARGETVAVKAAVRLSPGYHVNSNAPNDEYLIPLRLAWNAAPLEVLDVAYPKPRHENYSFSQKPVSVFSGEFEIVTRFKAPAAAPPGPAVLTGKLRYQACTESSCLPPKTVEVRLPVHVR